MNEQRSPHEAPDGLESAAAAEAFLTYSAALRAFVARRLSNPEEVEDLVQEAYARLITRARESTLEAPQAYLFKIASNLLMDRKRAERKSGGEMLPFEDYMADTPPLQEEARRYRDLQSQFEAALGELSPRCREIFLLRRFDDLDSAAIASQFGISRRMVQKYLIRATAHLYARLDVRPAPSLPDSRR